MGHLILGVVHTGLQRLVTALYVSATGVLLLLQACNRSTPPGIGTRVETPPSTATAFYATSFERDPDVATLTMLGRTLFFDSTLSASGRLSCATCHDPRRAYGPPDDRAVQFGGPDLDIPGLRAVPSLRYRQDTPPFDEHFIDDDGDDGVDQGPAGGRDWDGRVFSAHEQARGPLLSPFEMANRDSIDVVNRLRQSASAKAFRESYGTHVFDVPGLAWKGLLLALETFQQDAAAFYPYSSRYDGYLRGEEELTAAELRGLQVFNDPGRGNCAECHPSDLRRGAFPQFTDDGFAALGLPRNPAIPANTDPAWFDLGLCGPLRTDLEDRPEYCGMFKAPSLRNVALRPVFFHNGVFTHLLDAVRFYQYRDAEPARFYPRTNDGGVARFNDLPVRYRRNISFDAPFDSTPHPRPHFTDLEALDLVAFLRALTDKDMEVPSRSQR